MSNFLIYEHSGPRLTEKRCAAGLTVNELAAKARISPITLRSWESGGVKPQVTKLRQVRDALEQAVASPKPDTIDRDALPLELIVDRQALEFYMPRLWARIQKLHEDINLMHSELALVYHRIAPNGWEAQADD